MIMDRLAECERNDLLWCNDAIIIDNYNLFIYV